MSGTPFQTGTPRRNNSKPYRVKIREFSNESQEKEPAPPPPPREDSLSSNEGYKSAKNPFELCHEVVGLYDEEVCRRLKEEINFLMVVAGLFLAIVTAFTIESYKSLKEDKQDTMSDLLIEVVRLLNDTSVRGRAQLPETFAPSHRDIVVNQLWFSSMTLSLIAVSIGTFCLQWISSFSGGPESNEQSMPVYKSLALRQLRYEGMVGWGVLHAPEALLLIVQLSIGLFTCGLVYFLWGVSHQTAIPALVVTSLAGALLGLMNLLPYLQSILAIFLPAALSIPHCPYKSPASWLVLNTGNTLPYILKPVINLFSPGGWDIPLPWRWLNQLPLPFADVRWENHDLFSLHSRGTGEDNLDYFVLALVSALGELAYNPDIKDTIFRCLEELRPMFPNTGAWEAFSGSKLLPDEKHCLDNDLVFEHADEIRVDFLNALILQHVTSHNAKLDRILLLHRVELYTRVNNSARIIPRDDNTITEFGSSLLCPLKYGLYADRLNLELKFQFLKCVKYLIHIRRFSDSDIMSAAAIIATEGATTTISGTGTRYLSGNRQTGQPGEEELPEKEELPFEEELHVEELPVIEELPVKEELPADQQPVQNISGSQMASSPLNVREKNRSNTKETQFRASLKTLCFQVREQLFGIRRVEFQDEDLYFQLRDVLQLPDSKGSC